MKNIFKVLILITTFTYPQTQYRFHINNINMPIDNRGTLADVYQIPGGSLGKYNDIPFLFSGGFWLSGYNEDTLWASAQASASLIENYIPGNVGSNQYDPRYKIYVINRGDLPFSTSWQEWRFAVELGARFYDGDGDSIYNPVDLNGNNIWDPNEDKPDIIGDVTTWCVFNDGQLTRTRFANVPPMGIEIRQSLFGYYSFSSTQLRDVIFIRYEIVNTGLKNSILDSVYFTAWADPDLGEYQNDLVGSDTLSNSGYLYNDGEDEEFGANPPAFFINILQGPKVYIPGETFIDNNGNEIYDDGIDIPLDTAYNKMGSLKGIEIFPGAKNQNLSSFTRYISSDPQAGDPNDEFEARNYMLGMKMLGGIFDPCDPGAWGGVFGGIDCSTINPLYWYSGDPETNIGWLSTVGSDYRIVVNTGPFNLTQNEPVTIIVGYTIGQGSSATNSVTVTKIQSQFVQQFYQSNFNDNLVSVENEIISQPTDFTLYQNYPNPFNPNTTIKYSITSVISNGERNLNVALKVYDVLGREIVTLVSEEKPTGNYEVEFDASSFSSGIYLYKLQAGAFVQTKKMLLIK